MRRGRPGNIIETIRATSVQVLDHRYVLVDHARDCVFAGCANHAFFFSSTLEEN
jgi:hypothetical protein